MKKLLFTMMLMFGGSDVLLAMEPTERTEQIKIETSDEQVFEIPLEVAKKSITLRNMLEGIEGLQDDVPVPLPDIKAGEWKKVYELMKIDSAEELKKVLVSLSPDQLFEIVPPINFLDIFVDSSSVPDELETTENESQENRLLFYAMQELKQRICNNIADFDLIGFEKLDLTSQEIQDQIIQALLLSLSKFRLIKRFEGRFFSVHSPVWSPDGRRLAVGLFDAIKILDKNDWGEIAIIPVDHGITGCLWFEFPIVWSPNGRMLAIGAKHDAIQIWDTARWEQIKLLEGFNFNISWSPNGNEIALVSKKDVIIKILDRNNWQLVEILNEHERAYKGMWSPDGSKFASISDIQLVIWDSKSWNILSKLNPDAWIFDSIAWLDRNNVCAISLSDQPIRIWDMNAEREIAMYEGNSNGVKLMSLSPFGDRIAITNERKKGLEVWNVKDGQKVLANLKNTSSINSISWSPDATNIALELGGSIIEIWSPPYDNISQEIFKNTTSSQVYSTLCALSGMERKISSKRGLKHLPNRLRELIEEKIGKRLLD